MTTSDEATTHAIPQLIADMDNEIVASPLMPDYAAAATPGNTTHGHTAAHGAPHAAPHTGSHILPPLVSPPHTGGLGGSEYMCMCMCMSIICVHLYVYVRGYSCFMYGHSKERLCVCINGRAMVAVCLLP